MSGKNIWTVGFLMHISLYMWILPILIISMAEIAKAILADQTDLQVVISIIIFSLRVQTCRQLNWLRLSPKSSYYSLVHYLVCYLLNTDKLPISLVPCLFTYLDKNWKLAFQLVCSSLYHYFCTLNYFPPSNFCTTQEIVIQNVKYWFFICNYFYFCCYCYR